MTDGYVGSLVMGVFLEVIEEGVWGTTFLKYLAF